MYIHKGPLLYSILFMIIYYDDFQSHATLSQFDCNIDKPITKVATLSLNFLPCVSKAFKFTLHCSLLGKASDAQRESFFFF